MMCYYICYAAQVSFADGLDKLGARILQKQATGDRGGATLFEQYMARKKDRRDAQRALGRFAHVDSGSDSDGAGAARRRPRRGGAAPSDSGSGDDAVGVGGDAGGGDDGFDDPFFQVLFVQLCMRRLFHRSPGAGSVSGRGKILMVRERFRCCVMLPSSAVLNVGHIKGT